MATGRDKDATWCSLGTLGWSKPRALYQLRSGLPYRTFPPGHVIDWNDRRAELNLDVEASTTAIRVGRRLVTVGIEVLLRTEPEPPALSAEEPATLPEPKKISEADLHRCILDIVEKHPPNTPPLAEETLISEVENRLGAPLPRERIQAARNKVAPHFKLPVGRPRKNAQ